MSTKAIATRRFPTSGEAIRFNPNSRPTPYNNRAFIYCEKGEYDKAIADCTACIRVARNMPMAYFIRAFAYRKKGETGKADEDLARAKELGFKP